MNTRPAKIVHTNSVVPCPLCEIKLLDAHPDIAKWFRELVKPKHVDAHISWSYRDKINQNQAVAEGKSKLAYPLSFHNRCDENGKPRAEALDLFELCSNGMSRWAWSYFRTISDEAKIAGAPIEWGGEWKTISDGDHFQLKA